MIDAQEPPHHVLERHRTTIPWFDIAMAVAVLAVSFGSLFVALHTSHTMEKLVEQNQRLVRAQSTPILQYQHGNNLENEKKLYFSVKNVGTGPARIAWAKLNYKDKTYTWQEFALTSTPGLTRLPLQNSPIAPAVLSSGEERTVMQWPRTGDATQLKAWDIVEKARFEARPEACYCSVFDECWLSNMNGDVPRLVTSCESPHLVTASRSGH